MTIGYNDLRSFHLEGSETVWRRVITYDLKAQKYAINYLAAGDREIFPEREPGWRVL